MILRVACAQMSSALSDTDQNLNKICQSVNLASEEGAQMIVFPEAAVNGYYLEGGVVDSAISLSELSEELTERLPKDLRNIHFTVGYYEKTEGKIANSAASFSFSEGKLSLVHNYRKFFLPSYGVFDEHRFVTAGSQLGIFDTPFGSVGLLICEDIWHSILPTFLALKGAKIIFVLSASPGRGFKSDVPSNVVTYQNMLKAVSAEHGLYCINCQMCGFEGGKGFPGASMVVDPFGEMIAQAPLLEESLLVADLDLEKIVLARNQLPLLPDLRSNWKKLAAIACEIN